MEDKLDKIIELLEEMNSNILLLAQDDIKQFNESIDMVNLLRDRSDIEVPYRTVERLKKLND
jgi:hypothetical protein